MEDFCKISVFSMSQSGREIRFTLNLNSGSTGSIITACAVTTINDNAAGSTNRVMTSSGDAYR